MTKRRRLHAALAAAVAVLAVAGVFGLAAVSPRARVFLKASPLLQRLNSPVLRTIDAQLFNLGNRPPGPVALGDGGPVERVRLFDPMGLARDSAGALLVSDRGGAGPGRVLWRFDPAGAARVLAGTGRRGTTLAAANAREAALGSPQGICTGPGGEIYLADSYNHVVFRIEPSGSLSVVAGTGRPGRGGDGSPATSAELNQPYDVRLDAQGNLYIADVGNHRVRRVDPSGRITTVAGNGAAGYSGDGGPAIAARLREPYGIFLDSRYGLLIADSGNDVIRQVDSSGTIRTLAGTGVRGLSGNGGLALAARFDSPQSLFVDPTGRIFVNDEHNHVIRVIDPEGNVHRIAGNGSQGLSADGTSAADGPLNDVENMIVADGTLYFTEAGTRRLRLIDTEGRLRTIAGHTAAGADEH